jgi:hypothetical protein
MHTPYTLRAIVGQSPWRYSAAAVRPRPRKLPHTFQALSLWELSLSSALLGMAIR